MEKKVEMSEFLEVIDSDKYKESEGNISSNIEYLLIYRIRKFYGLYDDIMVRGSFEKIYDSNLLKGQDSVNYRIKQTLWQYGVVFSDKTFSNILYKDETDRKSLLILDSWDSISSLSDMLESDKFSVRPTDIYIESLKDNNEYDDIMQVLGNSQLEVLSVWYIRNNYDYYASYADKSRAYSSLFSDDERYDITADMHDMFDVVSMPANIIDSLINYGRALFDDGIKCIEFNDIIPKLSNVTEERYQYLCAAFLVYMSETYNMKINTTSDGMFCTAYNDYRSGNYLMAEDLLGLEMKLFPVMFYSTANNSRFIYLRDVITSYDYVYVTESELDKMVLDDYTVHMKLWKPEDRSIFVNSKYSSGTGYLNSKISSTKSSFVERISEEADDEYEPIIVPIFSRYSEEQIGKIAKTFNSYNIREHTIYSQKYVTVRDLLCRRVKDGDEYVYQIGFVFSGTDTQYGKRITQNLIVSGIEPDRESNIISRSYFTMPQDKIGYLYSVNYIYDLSREAPNVLVKLIDDTESLIDDVDDPMYDEDENGNPLHTVGSIEEKFLYYTFSRYLNKKDYDDLISGLSNDKSVFKPSIYRYVFVTSEIMPELSLKIKMYDLINAEFLTAFGDINPEYIRSGRTSNYLNLDSRLFGIMSSE